MGGGADNRKHKYAERPLPPLPPNLAQTSPRQNKYAGRPLPPLPPNLAQTSPQQHKYAGRPLPPLPTDAVVEEPQLPPSTPLPQLPRTRDPRRQAIRLVVQGQPAPGPELWNIQNYNEIPHQPFPEFRSSVARIGERKNTKVVEKFSQREWIAESTENIQTQDPDDPIVQNKSTLKAGVCRSLALTWIACRANNEDFFSYVKSNVNAQTVLTNQLEGSKFTQDARDQISRFEERRQKLLAIPNMDNKQFQEIVAKIDALQDRCKELIDAHRDKTLQKILMRLGNGESKLKKEGKTKNYDSIDGACKDFVGLEGYVNIKAQGKNGGHAIAAYISSDKVFLMDPNHGEVALDSLAGTDSDGTISGADGLRAHLQSMCKANFLGDCESVRVDYYPCRERPRGQEQPSSTPTPTLQADTGPQQAPSSSPPTSNSDSGTQE